MHACRSVFGPVGFVLALVLAVPAAAASGVAGTPRISAVGTAETQARPANLGRADWTQQSPRPTGQQLNAVDMVSAAVGWAVGEHGAIVHTDDGGETWNAQRSRTTEQLNAVRFADAMHGVAMGNIDLYTIDGGVTWRHGEGALGTVYDVEMADAQHAFASEFADFIYRTDNGGATWTRQDMPFVVARVQFFDALHGVASGAGIARTNDGGDTWKVLKGASGSPFFINFEEGWSVSADSARHTVDGGVTYESQQVPDDTWANDATFVDSQHGWAVGAESNIISTDNGGATWVKQRGGVGSAVANRYPLNAVDFADIDRGVAVGNCGTILSTKDGGDTWRERLSGSCTLTYDIAATDAKHLWASQSDGEVLRTVDGGRHWRRVITPVADLSGSYLGAVDFVDDRNGWVVSSAGTIGDQFIFHTTDGGRTWDQQGPSGQPANLFGIDSVDGETVVAVGYVCCVGPQITRSTDGGKTWEVLPPQLSPYGGRYRAVQFATVDTGWIGGDGGALLKTTDGGATWKQQNPLGLYGSGATFIDLSFVDDQTGWVAAYVSASEGFLLHTTDGGRTWTKQALPVPAVTRVVATPREVWIGGDGAVARSTNGGNDWTVERPAREGSYGAIAVAGRHVWAGGFDVREGTGGIWRR